MERNGWDSTVDNILWTTLAFLSPNSFPLSNPCSLITQLFFLWATLALLSPNSFPLSNPSSLITHLFGYWSILQELKTEDEWFSLPLRHRNIQKWHSSAKSDTPDFKQFACTLPTVVSVALIQLGRYFLSTRQSLWDLLYRKSYKNLVH